MSEAAIGMGATQTQVVWHILLPTALPGILTGVLLALARGAGETAPLLFTMTFSDYWLSRHQQEKVEQALRGAALWARASERPPSLTEPERSSASRTKKGRTGR